MKTMNMMLASVIAMAAVIFSLGAVAYAQDVNVFPTRVVLEDRTRGAEVVVFNRGDRPNVYRIELQDQRMTPDGRLEAFDEAHPRPADWRSAVDYVRFSPRQVTLSPGQSQTIRLAARRPPDLAAGEYRSHLSIVTVPPSATGDSIERAAGALSRSEIGITLTPIYGVSIPVIVRVGEPRSTVALQSPRLISENGHRYMVVELQRGGEASAYADLEVLWSNGGASRRIGMMRGVAVYPELSGRTVRVAVDPDATGDLRGGITTIRYVVDARDARSAVLAEIQGPGL